MAGILFFIGSPEAYRKILVKYPLHKRVCGWRDEFNKHTYHVK